MRPRGAAPGAGRSNRMQGYITIVAFGAVGFGMVAVALVVSRLLRPHAPSPEKGETYECGPAPFGDAWRQFNTHYYLYALLFVVFDVEAAFLYPWALAFRKVGIYAVIEMFIFVGLLLAGWAWAWRRRAIDWE